MVLGLCCKAQGVSGVAAILAARVSLQGYLCKGDDEMTSPGLSRFPTS